MGECKTNKSSDVMEELKCHKSGRRILDCQKVNLLGKSISYCLQTDV